MPWPLAGKGAAMRVTAFAVFLLPVAAIPEPAAAARTDACRQARDRLDALRER